MLLSLLVLLLPLVLLHLGDEEHLAVLLALLPLRQQRLPRLELVVPESPIVGALFKIGSILL